MSNIISNPEVTLRAIQAVYNMTGSREATGSILGVSGQSVIRLLAENGMPVRKPGRPKSQLTAPALVNSYWAKNMSLREIARKAGVSHTTVARKMQSYGIPTRPAV